MADGGQTVDQWHLVDLAARRLARVLGYGPSWFADVREVPDDERVYETAEGVDRFQIMRRGHVVEQAAQSINGSGRVKRQYRWRHTPGVAALPVAQPDTDAIAALSFAKLDGPLEAILVLYATGDVGRYWPTVKRFGLARCASWPDDCAITDAMQRILCGRAATSQDDRAKDLRKRASAYRELTREYERRLRDWLKRAASRFLAGV